MSNRKRKIYAYLCVKRENSEKKRENWKEDGQRRSDLNRLPQDNLPQLDLSDRVSLLILSFIRFNRSVRELR